MRGDSDHPTGTEHPARDRHGKAVGAQMDSVQAEGHRQIHAIIDEHRRALLARETENFLGKAE
jgi:hypothetical protein